MQSSKSTTRQRTGLTSLARSRSLQPRSPQRPSFSSTTGPTSVGKVQQASQPDPEATPGAVGSASRSNIDIIDSEIPSDVWGGKVIDFTQLPMSDEFEALARTEGPRLLNYFARRANRQDSADLLADVLLVAWRRRKSIPVDETAAQCGCRCRPQNARQPSSVPASGMTRWRRDCAAGEVKVTPNGPEAEDDRALTLDLLELVDPKDREILMLVYWDGFALDGVARLLRQNPSTIRARRRTCPGRELRSVIEVGSTDIRRAFPRRLEVGIWQIALRRTWAGGVRRPARIPPPLLATGLRRHKAELVCCSAVTPVRPSHQWLHRS